MVCLCGVGRGGGCDIFQLMSVLSNGHKSLYNYTAKESKPPPSAERRDNLNCLQVYVHAQCLKNYPICESTCWGQPLHNNMGQSLLETNEEITCTDDSEHGVVDHTVSMSTENYLANNTFVTREPYLSQLAMATRPAQCSMHRRSRPDTPHRATLLSLLQHYSGSPIGI